MKQALLFCLFTVLSFPLFSQCVPDELYRDSSVGVYPPPDPAGMDDPDRGITESACINAGYEFVLTFKIPPTVNFNGSDIPLDSIVIAETGAVSGLPVGITYGCNPGNCVFSTETDSLACLVLQGTATSDNTPGIYELGISTTIWSNGFPLPLTFPTSAIPGADGEYNLLLEEEGSMTCFVTSTDDDYLTQNVRITNNPNPFRDFTNIEIYSDINEQLNFIVFDMLGNVVHQDQIEIFEGDNIFEFDGSALASGMYTFSLSSDLGTVTRKIIVSK